MPAFAPCHALVPAAGSGSRMAAGLPKQYLPLAGRPLLYYALRTLCACEELASVHVVLAPTDLHWPQYAPLWAQLGDKLCVHHCGGDSRAASVLAGLAAMAARGVPRVAPDDWVLVHDAARPGLSPGLLRRLIATLKPPAGMKSVGTDHAAEAALCGAILALPLADTLKRARPQTDGAVPLIEVSVARAGLWQAQTPQMFRRQELQTALTAQLALADPDSITDEASAMERQGQRVALVPGELSNFKVTYASDLALAELILRHMEN